MPTCLIGLGSNVGDRAGNLDRALTLLAGEAGFCLRARSSWRVTHPVGGPQQHDFLNGAAQFETPLEPHAVLRVLLRVEAQMGRGREIRWGPRPIDLDLLLYDQRVITGPELIVPHPRMAWRRFVLEPAAEIAAEMLHPALGWTVGRLLAHLNTAASYVAITGPIGVGKTELAAALAKRGDVRWLPETLDLAALEAFYRDPAGRAWAMELEFLQQRARALDRSAPEWSGSGPPVVTDFWFDQSPAFARIWLAPDRWPAFNERWESVRREVVRPKLTVWLDTSADTLRQRIAERGRRGEEVLSAELLDRLRQTLADCLRLPDQGPVLRLDGSADREALVSEVTTAIDSWK